MNVTWEGVDRLEKLLVELKDRIAAAETGAALFEEGEQIMTRSQRDFVPVDLGVLRGSGHVVPPVRRGNRVTVELGYGGAASAYAVVQHERLDYHHDVGQAKYLEQPVLEAAAGMAGRLAARINLTRRA